MLRALRLLMTVSGNRAGLAGRHAKALAGQGAALAVLGLATLIFATILATVALARWLGTLQALGIMTGVSAAGFVVVLLVLQASRRAHAERMRRQASEDRRMMQAALLTAIPRLHGGGLLAVAAGVAALTLILRRSDDGPTD